MTLTSRVGGRRGLQVATLSLALLVVLGFLALDTLGRPRATTTVFVMTHSVLPGTSLDGSSVREENIAATEGSYAYLGAFPTGRFAAHALSPGDILRPDDVEALPTVAVPVKLGGYQPGTGEAIDVYVVDGGRAKLVGRNVTVVNAGTLQVPASDEALWIALYGSSATLVAARSNGTGVPDEPAMTGAEAARRLAVLAGQGPAPDATPTP